ncbi:MAG TPA: twin-arginine translocase TatA/TatE family subunit, partial [Candidatus Methylacidiphilales bacterium]|nr:twin-arginine translocase TatA/TatE family subunit [Candidatus Methylacidiphilales bacterium]
MSFNCWAYLAFLPSGPEWLYIGVLFVLLFGADKLPQFARGLGRTLGEFKRAKEEMEEELRRATQEDTRPRIRPRADGDDDAMPPSPKTLPVTNESSATALPAPEEGVTSSTVAASAAAEPVTTASATTTAAAVTATAVTPILRPVATAVAFGSAR